MAAIVGRLDRSVSRKRYSLQKKHSSDRNQLMVLPVVGKRLGHGVGLGVSKVK